MSSEDYWEEYYVNEKGEMVTVNSNSGKKFILDKVNVMYILYLG